MCRKQPGLAIGCLCERDDGKCVICDSYVRPCTLESRTLLTVGNVRSWKKIVMVAPRLSTSEAPRWIFFTNARSMDLRNANVQLPHIGLALDVGKAAREK
ncbi:unnamed protein product [Peronospora belbahrii]|uniref:Uncharacterized protein n=1 Tax=Peronospora belbahrii TaxID=622444 RepID=A0AAU9KWL5_9STRA|nr:unnamed protein product [Peronospora belbahrii]